MSRSICVTEKRIHRVKNINPELSKIRAVDSIRIQRQLKNTRKSMKFSRNSQLLSSTKNNTEGLAMWGTAVDIDI